MTEPINLARIGQMVEQVDGVVAAYLTGSVAVGRATPISDIDFAFWLNRVLSPQERFDCTMDLLNLLCNEVGNDHVDVVVLNDAPPAVRYGVLKEAKLFFCKDKEQLAQFVVQAYQSYFDWSPFMQIQQEALRERLLTGRFGHVE